MPVAVHMGDNLPWLRSLPDNSVDSLVDDPPYGLSKPPPIEELLSAWLAGDDYDHDTGGFMGRKWDALVPGPVTWREVFRVMKPGAHGVVFSGQRTIDLMGIALRLAGFEVRDCCGWTYWNGFPKNHDIGKSVDGIGGSSAEFSAFRDACRDSMKLLGVTRAEVNTALGNYMASHYLTKGSQPAVPGWQDYCVLRGLLHLGDKWDDAFAPPAGREITGQHASGLAVGAAGVGGSGVGRARRDNPATPAAQQWDGFGTALKPCIEPFLLIRKPLAEGTIARQVLATGTGALNIDGCRYPFGDKAWPGPQGKDDLSRPGNAFRGPILGDGKEGRTAGSDIGRFPANIYHCPKASTKERERGCDSLPEVAGHDIVSRKEGSAGLENPRAGAGRKSKGRKNTHNTIKPVRLMRWLCRLVTPPGGTILEPFMGSGTTGVAASLEGFDCIGAEFMPEYHAIAEARIAHAIAHPEEWADTTPGDWSHRGAPKKRKPKKKATRQPSLFPTTTPEKSCP